jgi:hypothetical protein
LAQTDPEPQNAALHGPTFAVVAPVVGLLLFLLVLGYRDCARSKKVQTSPAGADASADTRGANGAEGEWGWATAAISPGRASREAASRA